VDKRLVADGNILTILKMLELEITSAQSVFDGYMVEYTGTGPHFPEIEEGQAVPLYEVLEYNGKLIVKPKEEEA
jgi:hypothetical protein